MDFAGSDGWADWGKCGDKRDRKVQCNVVKPAAADAPVTCTCSVGGVIGKTFKMENTVTGTTQLATLAEATKLANEQCGWNLSR